MIPGAVEPLRVATSLVGLDGILRVTEVLVTAMRGGVWGSRTETRTCTRDVEAGELLQRGDLL